MQTIKVKQRVFLVPEHAGLIMCCDGVPVFKTSGMLSNMSLNVFISYYCSTNIVASTYVHYFSSPGDSDECRKYDGLCIVARTLQAPYENTASTCMFCPKLTN